MRLDDVSVFIGCECILFQLACDKTFKVEYAVRAYYIGHLGRFANFSLLAATSSWSQDRILVHKVG